MIHLGLDWADDHHDIAVMDEAGTVLAEKRVPDTMEGVADIHALVAEHEADPSCVIVGIETTRGLVPQALVAAGYLVYEVNPLAASRYRDRHHLSGAKSDRGDAKMLADVVRTDRHNHRPYLGNTDLSESIKILARTHQELIHQRQTQVNAMRATLRSYYPAILMAFPAFAAPSERDSQDAMALLEVAPTPAQGRALSRSQIGKALRAAGRQRRVSERADTICTALRAPQLHAPSLVTDAHGDTVRAHAAIVQTMTRQIAVLEQRLTSSFEEHPDATIIRSLPGLGNILGARALGEFGDAPNRYVNAKARKNYATTSPVTRASGKLRIVAARHGGNRRLGETTQRWAFCALQASPGAKRYYEQLKGRQKTHSQAIRAVANRMVGLLHFCLERRVLYDETIAWPQAHEQAA